VHRAHGITCGASDPLTATRETQFMERGSGYTCYFGCSIPTCGAQDVGADAQPWLEADLGTASAVQRVVAYHASEAGLHINASYVIETSNTRAEGSWSVCADAARHHGAIQSTRCSAQARYVRMRLAEPGCFQLREFEVYTSACGTTGAAALTSIVAHTADNTTETGVGTVTATRTFGGARLKLSFADVTDGTQWLPFHRSVPDGEGTLVGNMWCGAPSSGLCTALPTNLIDATGAEKTVKHCEHGNYQMPRKNGTNIFGGILIKKGVECTSADEKLGEDWSEMECESECRITPGCQYYIFGTGDNAGKCWWEKTNVGAGLGIGQDSNPNPCPDGYEDDEYDFYQIRGDKSSVDDHDPYANDVIMCKGYASSIVYNADGSPNVDADMSTVVPSAQGITCDAADPFSATPTNMYKSHSNAMECYFDCSICADAAFGDRCGPEHEHHRCTGGTTSVDQMVFHSNMRKTFCDREGKCGNSPRYFETEAGVRSNAQYDFVA
jgi:hypothetical protein